MVLGDPVPAEAEAPMPAAVVVDGPAPGLRGDPVPADDGIPDPAAVKVGAPVGVGDVRNPDISVGPFIDPLTVLVELFFVLLEVGRKVLPFASLGELRIA
jgi:hypothetical protein